MTLYGNWMKLALESWALGVEASQVIGLRTMQMATGRASPDEVTRMVSEKVEAAMDLQVQAIVNNFNVTTNAARAKIKGFDADLTWRATPEFTMTAGVAYLHARFTSYPNATTNDPILFTSGHTEDNILRGAGQKAVGAFLPKPYRRAELARKLAEALQETR